VHTSDCMPNQAPDRRQVDLKAISSSLACAYSPPEEGEFNEYTLINPKGSGTQEVRKCETDPASEELSALAQLLNIGMKLKRGQNQTRLPDAEESPSPCRGFERGQTTAERCERAYYGAHQSARKDLSPKLCGFFRSVTSPAYRPVTRYIC